MLPDLAGGVGLHQSGHLLPRHPAAIIANRQSRHPKLIQTDLEVIFLKNLTKIPQITHETKHKVSFSDSVGEPALGSIMSMDGRPGT